MSLIGLLTATEKQVHLGRLHMRPIQWHLKVNWRIPESLQKMISIPRSLHPHVQWWLEESNVLQGQPLHPLQHALQIFTDASKEGWGAHLNERIARGSWSVPESKLHINYLELKAVFLALKEFQDLCVDKIVLVATDHTTVVSYINKEGDMPWFCDLVTMSSQVPISLPILPNLLTQPFNQIPHRNLTNLNLHAWLLEPQRSGSRGSLRQWRQELRLLREDQPDQSMRQSGPFLQSGASLIRWTSGHPL